MALLPELMTVGEAAEALHVTDETVHRWCREGRLDYADVLGNKRLFREDIEILVSRRNAGAGTAPAPVMGGLPAGPG